jgi:ketosteroid isomerase-like protein
VRAWMSCLLPAVVSLGIAASGPAAKSGAGVATEPLPADLDRVLRDYERAWEGKDAGALADLFDEDGFVLSSGQPPARGREAIREAYAHAGGPLWLQALSHAAQGEVGYIIGVFGHDPNQPATGKFVLALRRHGAGPWLIAGDIDNSSRRDAGPARGAGSGSGRRSP